MTTQEAIEMLKTICGDCRLFPKCAHTESACFTALDMAIEALTELDNNSTKVDRENDELSCSEKPNMSDAIYRQDALELVDWYQREFLECDYAFGELGNELHKLPSAQPNLQPTCNQLATDCISRQAAIYYVKQATIGETDVMKAWVKAQTHLMRLPSAQPEHLVKESGDLVKDLVNDCISRQDAIDAVAFGITHAKAFNKETGEVMELFAEGNKELRKAVERIEQLPSAQPEITLESAIDYLHDIEWMQEHDGIMSASAQTEWNNHTVACLLADLFDDTCACNYNGIDEWLPEKCEVIDSCPNPVGVACWEQFLKHRAERRTDE